MSVYSRMHACKSSWYSSTTFQEHVAHAVVALLHDLLARLVRRRFVVAVAAVAVVHGAPAVNVVGAAAAAASCALCPFRSSSWSLPHGVFLMEEDVALSLCELACMKVVVVVAVLFQRAWLVRCTESALPAARPPPPPFDSNGDKSLFSPLLSSLPKSQKRTFWDILGTLPVNLSGPCCVPLGKASFYPNVTSIIGSFIEILLPYQYLVVFMTSRR